MQARAVPARLRCSCDVPKVSGRSQRPSLGLVWESAVGTVGPHRQEISNLVWIHVYLALPLPTTRFQSN